MDTDILHTNQTKETDNQTEETTDNQIEETTDNQIEAIDTNRTGENDNNEADEYFSDCEQIEKAPVIIDRDTSMLTPESAAPVVTNSETSSRIETYEMFDHKNESASEKLDKLHESTDSCPVFQRADEDILITETDIEAVEDETDLKEQSCDSSIEEGMVSSSHGKLNLTQNNEDESETALLTEANEINSASACSAEHVELLKEGCLSEDIIPCEQLSEDSVNITSDKMLCLASDDDARNKRLDISSDVTSDKMLDICGDMTSDKILDIPSGNMISDKMLDMSSGDATSDKRIRSSGETRSIEIIDVEMDDSQSAKNVLPILHKLENKHINNDLPSSSHNIFSRGMSSETDCNINQFKPLITDENAKGKDINEIKQQKSQFADSLLSDTIELEHTSLLSTDPAFGLPCSLSSAASCDQGKNIKISSEIASEPFIETIDLEEDQSSPVPVHNLACSELNSLVSRDTEHSSLVSQGNITLETANEAKENLDDKNHQHNVIEKTPERNNKDPNAQSSLGMQIDVQDIEDEHEQSGDNMSETAGLEKNGEKLVEIQEVDASEDPPEIVDVSHFTKANPTASPINPDEDLEEIDDLEMEVQELVEDHENKTNVEDQAENFDISKFLISTNATPVKLSDDSCKSCSDDDEIISNSDEDQNVIDRDSENAFSFSTNEVVELKDDFTTETTTNPEIEVIDLDSSREASPNPVIEEDFSYTEYDTGKLASSIKDDGSPEGTGGYSFDEDSNVTADIPDENPISECNESQKSEVIADDSEERNMSEFIVNTTSENQKSELIADTSTDFCENELELEHESVNTTFQNSRKELVNIGINEDSIENASDNALTTEEISVTNLNKDICSPMPVKETGVYETENICLELNTTTSALIPSVEEITEVEDDLNEANVALEEKDKNVIEDGSFNEEIAIAKEMFQEKCVEIEERLNVENAVLEESSTEENASIQEGINVENAPIQEGLNEENVSVEEGLNKENLSIQEGLNEEILSIQEGLTEENASIQEGLNEDVSIQEGLNENLSIQEGLGLNDDNVSNQEDLNEENLITQEGLNDENALIPAEEDASIQERFSEENALVQEGLNEGNNSIQEGLNEENASFQEELTEEDPLIQKGLNEENAMIQEGLNEENASIQEGLNKENFSILEGLNEDESIQEGLNEEDASVQKGLNEEKASIGEGLADENASILEVLNKEASTEENASISKELCQNEESAALEDKLDVSNDESIADKSIEIIDSPEKIIAEPNKCVSTANDVRLPESIHSPKMSPVHISLSDGNLAGDSIDVAKEEDLLSTSVENVDSTQPLPEVDNGQNKNSEERPVDVDSLDEPNEEVLKQIVDDSLPVEKEISDSAKDTSQHFASDAETSIKDKGLVQDEILIDCKTVEGSNNEQLILNKTELNLSGTDSCIDISETSESKILVEEIPRENVKDVDTITTEGSASLIEFSTVTSTSNKESAGNCNEEMDEQCQDGYQEVIQLSDSDYDWYEPTELPEGGKEAGDVSATQPAEVIPVSATQPAEVVPVSAAQPAEVIPEMLSKVATEYDGESADQAEETILRPDIEIEVDDNLQSELLQDSAHIPETKTTTDVTEIEKEILEAEEQKEELVTATEEEIPEVSEKLMDDNPLIEIQGQDFEGGTFKRVVIIGDYYLKSHSTSYPIDSNVKPYFLLKNNLTVKKLYKEFGNHEYFTGCDNILVIVFAGLHDLIHLKPVNTNKNCPANHSYMNYKLPKAASCKTLQDVIKVTNAMHTLKKKFETRQGLSVVFNYIPFVSISDYVTKVIKEINDEKQKIDAGEVQCSCDDLHVKSINIRSFYDTYNRARTTLNRFIFSKKLNSLSRICNTFFEFMPLDIVYSDSKFSVIESRSKTNADGNILEYKLKETVLIVDDQTTAEENKNSLTWSLRRDLQRMFEDVAGYKYRIIIIGDTWLQAVAEIWGLDMKVKPFFYFKEGLTLDETQHIILSLVKGEEKALVLTAVSFGDLFVNERYKHCDTHRALYYPVLKGTISHSPTKNAERICRDICTLQRSVAKSRKYCKVTFMTCHPVTLEDYHKYLIKAHEKESVSKHLIKGLLFRNSYENCEQSLNECLRKINDYVIEFNMKNKLHTCDISSLILHVKGCLPFSFPCYVPDVSPSKALVTKLTALFKEYLNIISQMCKKNTFSFRNETPNKLEGTDPNDIGKQKFRKEFRNVLTTSDRSSDIPRKMEPNKIELASNKHEKKQFKQDQAPDKKEIDQNKWEVKQSKYMEPSKHENESYKRKRESNRHERETRKREIESFQVERKEFETSRKERESHSMELVSRDQRYQMRDEEIIRPTPDVRVRYTRATWEYVGHPQHSARYTHNFEEDTGPLHPSQPLAPGGHSHGHRGPVRTDNSRRSRSRDRHYPNRRSRSPYRRRNSRSRSRGRRSRSRRRRSRSGSRTSHSRLRRSRSIRRSPTRGSYSRKRSRSRRRSHSRGTRSRRSRSRNRRSKSGSRNRADQKRRTDEALTLLRETHDRECDRYRMNPELHPEYQGVKSMWLNVQQAQGVNPFSPNLDVDWAVYWQNNMEYLFNVSWESKKESFMEMHNKKRQRSRSYSHSSSSSNRKSSKKSDNRKHKSRNSKKSKKRKKSRKDSESSDSSSTDSSSEKSRHSPTVEKRVKESGKMKTFDTLFSSDKPKPVTKDTTNIDKQKSEAENLLYVTGILSQISEKFGAIGIALSGLHEKLRNAMIKGENPFKLIDSDSEMLLMLVKDKMKLMMKDNTLTLVQKTVIQEAHEKLIPVIENIKAANTNAEEELLERIAKATLKMPAPEVVQYIKTSLMYGNEGETVSAERIKNAYVKVKELQMKLISENRETMPGIIPETKVIREEKIQISNVSSSKKPSVTSIFASFTSNDTPMTSSASYLSGNKRLDAMASTSHQSAYKLPSTSSSELSRHFADKFLSLSMGEKVKKFSQFHSLSNTEQLLLLSYLKALDNTDTDLADSLRSLIHTRK